MRTVFWEDNQLKMIDQRILPGRFEVVCVQRSYSPWRKPSRIWSCAARQPLEPRLAFGLALAGYESTAELSVNCSTIYKLHRVHLKAARPTAVNLAWALDRILDVCGRSRRERGADDLRQLVLNEAQRIADEDVEINKRMAEHGAALINDGDTIIHHCNTGALATVDWGTALGVIRTAHEQGKRIHVLVDETRPRLQGARLTAWELEQYGIPYEIISDNMLDIFSRQAKCKKFLRCGPCRRERRCGEQDRNLHACPCCT